MRPEFFHELVEGLRLAQNLHIDQAFEELKRSWGDPDVIVEIGTHYGGFSVFLAKMFPGVIVHTFDPYEWGTPDEIQRKHNIFKQYGIQFHGEDCFENDGAKIRSVIKRKALICCDGAHKKNEFAFFSQYIEPGSVILAHDYGRNEKYFRENIQDKYWTSSFEFDGSQVEDWCKNHNLNPYLQEVFEKAVWFIRKKF